MATVTVTLENRNSYKDDDGLHVLFGELPAVGLPDGIAFSDEISKEIFDCRTFDVRKIIKYDGTKETAGLNAYVKGMSSSDLEIDLDDKVNEPSIGWLNTSSEPKELLLGRLVETFTLQESNVIVSSVTVLNKKMVFVFFKRSMVADYCNAHGIQTCDFAGDGTSTFELNILKVPMPFPTNAAWVGLKGSYLSYATRKTTTPLQSLTIDLSLKINAPEEYETAFYAIESSKSVDVSFRHGVLMDAVGTDYGTNGNNANTAVASIIYKLADEGYIKFGHSEADVSPRSPRTINSVTRNPDTQEISKLKEELRVSENKRVGLLADIASVKRDLEIKIKAHDETQMKLYELEKPMSVFTGESTLSVTKLPQLPTQRCSEYVPKKYEILKRWLCISGMIYLDVVTVGGVREIVPFHEAFELSEYVAALEEARKNEDENTADVIEWDINKIREIYDMERKSAEGMLYILDLYSA